MRNSLGRPLQREWAIARLTTLTLIGNLACGGGDPSAPPTATTITLTQSSVSLVGIGVTVGVQATVLDASGNPVANPSITWRSDNDQVVTVSGTGSTGLLTSKAPGATSVTAMSGTATASASVSVEAQVRSVTATPATLTLTYDDERTATLTASSTSDPGVTVNYTWSSSNPAVATVTPDAASTATATVTALAAGTAIVTLTARTQFGAEKTVTIPVTSTKAVRAVILPLRKTDIGIDLSTVLEVRVTGEPGFPRTVTWTSRNPAIAQVGFAGRVLGVSSGTATIVATSTADATLRDSASVQVTATPYSLTDFVLAPPGTFNMGSPNFPADQPVHQVTLTKAFLVQKTEVTQAQWLAVMANNPSTQTQCGLSGLNCPVQNVSWDAVQIFIGKLNDASPGITYRLMTEAEWEYAARAGSTLDYYGPEHDIAWVASNAGGTIHPVAQKRPNAWGLYDVQGNVGEWCADGPRTYTASPVIDPIGPSSLTRSIRGSSFRSQPSLGRVSIRGEGLTNGSVDFIGVRLARTP